MQKTRTDVEISCFPKDLPEYLEVDIESLELDQIMHLSDTKIPDGVEITDLVAEPFERPHRVPRESPSGAEVGAQGAGDGLPGLAEVAEGVDALHRGSGPVEIRGLAVLCPTEAIDVPFREKF